MELISDMKKANYKNKQQMLRVQSLSGRGRPVLLPFNIENVKSIKIINASNFREQNIQLNSSASLYATKSPSATSEDIEGNLYFIIMYKTINLYMVPAFKIAVTLKTLNQFFNHYLNVVSMMYQLCNWGYFYVIW